MVLKLKKIMYVKKQKAKDSMYHWSIILPFNSNTNLDRSLKEGVGSDHYDNHIGKLVTSYDI